MVLHHRGFPIRKSAAITDISSLPQLIAGNRVLLRLSVPRHSPYALFRLNSSSPFFFRNFKLFAWASQIIVLWVVNYKKAFCFLLIHVLLSAPAFLKCKMQNAKCKIVSAGVDEIVFYPYLYGKTFWLVSFFTLLPNNKFFSIYNYLFRFFCSYSVFNEHF